MEVHGEYGEHYATSSPTIHRPKANILRNDINMELVGELSLKSVKLFISFVSKLDRK